MATKNRATFLDPTMVILISRICLYFVFFPQQHKLMGSWAQNSSVCTAPIHKQWLWTRTQECRCKTGCHTHAHTHKTRYSWKCVFDKKQLSVGWNLMEFRIVFILTSKPSTSTWYSLWSLAPIDPQTISDPSSTEKCHVDRQRDAQPTPQRKWLRFSWSTAAGNLLAARHCFWHVVSHLIFSWLFYAHLRP